MPSVIELRAHAREIFNAGIASADSMLAVRKHVQLSNDRLRVADRSYDFTRIRKIFVAGCGKATARMALAIEELLGERIADGLIVVKYGHGLPLGKIKVVEAGHPIPDQSGLGGALKIAELLKSAAAGDLIVFLISGGGSALLPYPAPGLSLADKQRTTEVLLKSGAAIDEVNAVRKHLSQLKGGQLARLASPARLISLVISDVVGDSLQTIASGPTVPDSSTYGECLEILHRHDLWTKIPANVARYLERGAKGEIEETPKPASEIFKKVQNVIVGNNRTAIDGAKRHAEALGYHTVILSDSVVGESRIVATSFSTAVKEFARTNKPISRPACLIAGGETTVAVRGDGLGGRNQEFVLAAAIEIAGMDNVVVLGAGTDGSDGPTDAAGGIVDGSTLARGSAQALDARAFLDRNDSYHFLEATDDLLKSGPTLTNVMDLHVALIA
jgi:glycerate 2-kinase